MTCRHGALERPFGSFYLLGVAVFNESVGVHDELAGGLAVELLNGTLVNKGGFKRVVHLAKQFWLSQKRGVVASQLGDLFRFNIRDEATNVLGDVLVKYFAWS